MSDEEKGLAVGLGIIFVLFVVGGLLLGLVSPWVNGTKRGSRLRDTKEAVGEGTAKGLIWGLVAVAVVLVLAVLGGLRGS